MPKPQQHPGAVCLSPLLQAVAALYLPHVSSLVQKTGMPMHPYSEQPCASQHGMDASEADTAWEDSRPAPVQIFRWIFNIIFTLILLAQRNLHGHFLPSQMIKSGTCCGVDNVCKYFIRNCGKNEILWNVTNKSKLHSLYPQNPLDRSQMGSRNGLQMVKNKKIPKYQCLLLH